MSSLFPNPYIQNGEQTTYVFRSRNPTDKVVIEFDDFDIAPGGALYVSISFIHLIISKFCYYFHF